MSSEAGSHETSYQPAVSGDVGFSASYRRGALALLMLIYVCNFLDRQVVNILAQSIKTDLMLTDGQLGAISGLAFALFYSLLGIPIARYAEVGDRPRIIAIAVGVWSIFTALCGLAQNFTHMLLARIGVGVGEAGGVPPSHSLITEFTPKERRASALAVYSMALPLGAFLGFALGGLIADAFGWRMAFFIAGAPGMLLALVAVAVLKESRRELPVDLLRARQQRPALGDALRLLWGKRSYRCIAAAAGLQSFVGYGIAAFTAPFFLRVHGVELKALADAWGLQTMGFLGIALGLSTGLVAAVGTLIGGRLADRLARKSPTHFPTVPAVAVLLAVPGFLITLTLSNVVTALIVLALPSALMAAWYGPVHAMCQGIVPPSMRATVSALTLVIINLVGLGLGPPFIGVISDLAQTHWGMDAAAGLRTAMLAMLPFCVICAGFYWAARRNIVGDTVS